MSEERQDNSPALGGRHSRTGREPRLGGETALHHLAMSLESDDWQTRRQAADALRELGAGATTLLVEALRSENMHTRRVAAQSLGLVGGTEAVDALIKALEDEQSLVRSDTSSALIRQARRMDDTLLRTHLVRALIKHTRHYSSHNRTYKDLHAIREEVALSLVDILLDEDVDNSSVAWKLLRDSETLVTGGQHHINTIFELIGCLANTSSEFQGDDLAVIHAMRGELVSSLRALIQTDDPMVRDEIRERLGAYPHGKIAATYRILARANSPHIRSIAIQWLRLLHDQDSIALITNALLNDPSRDVRAVAPEALAWLQGRAALPTIEQAIGQETDSYVRSRLIASLGSIDYEKHISYILDTATNDSNEQARAIAITQLGVYLRDANLTLLIVKRILEVLVAALDGPVLSRVATIDGLSNLASREELDDAASSAVANALIRLLRDDDAYIRGNAALHRRSIYALEKIGTPEALVAVEKWRREQNPNQSDASLA